VKLLYLHPAWYNIGDTLVEAGAKFLVHEAIGWHHFHQVRLDDVPCDGIMYYDCVVVVGTPWFWSLCQVSEKYGWLRRIAALPCSKRIVLGAGSAFELTADWKEELPVDTAWTHFGFMAARDWITHQLWPKSVPLCCPSLFAAEAFGVKPGRPSMARALVYASLDCKSITADFMSAQLKQQIMDEQDRFIRDGAAVLTMNCWDKAAFDLAHPGHCATHVTDPEQLLQMLAYYEEVVSLRVHACAAALSLGRRAKIWPIDTRAYAVTSCGAEPLLDMPTAEPICTSRSAWIEQIKNAIL